MGYLFGLAKTRGGDDLMTSSELYHLYGLNGYRWQR